MGLERLSRIEAFDNSNIQGTNPVSAMVVFIDGKPARKEYRKYKVRTVVGADDYGTMREVIRRRYERVLKENLPIPDLIVVDGGKGKSPLLLIFWRMSWDYSFRSAALLRMISIRRLSFWLEIRQSLSR